MAQVLTLVCYSEYEATILEGAPDKARLLFLRATGIEPWDEPKKKEDAEPDNEVSKKDPQQKKGDAGPVDPKEIRRKIKYLVSREAVKMVAKILKKKSDPSYLALEVSV